MANHKKPLWDAGRISIAGKLAVYAKCLVVIGAFWYVPLGSAAAMRRLKLLRHKLALAVGILLAILTPAPKSAWFQQSWLMKQVLKYFRASVVGESPPSGRQAVYGMAPHGIVPFSLGLTAFGGLNKIMGGLRIVTATATRLVPFFSHTLRFGGSIYANREVVDAALARGESLGITPGGIAEMFYGYPQPGCHRLVEYAVLNKRKGFVKLAIKYGTDLVPTFIFGASKLYRRIVLPKIVEDISNYLRMSMVLFYGRLGLPIPFEIPMTYALGHAIETSHWGSPKNPAPEVVDFVHNTFKAGLVRAFDDHKTAYGWGDRTLKLV
jgi:hypothetical protein